MGFIITTNIETANSIVSFFNDETLCPPTFSISLESVASHDTYTEVHCVPRVEGEPMKANDIYLMGKGSENKRLNPVAP